MVSKTSVINTGLLSSDTQLLYDGVVIIIEMKWLVVMFKSFFYNVTLIESMIIWLLTIVENNGMIELYKIA